MTAVRERDVEGPPQRKVQRSGEGEVRGRGNAEEVGHQGVGSLVVLGTADSVNEQVGEKHSCKERG